MRSKIYAAGIAGVVVLLAPGFQLLPSPGRRGGGLVSAPPLVPCRPGCRSGLLYKYDADRSREKLARSLKEGAAGCRGGKTGRAENIRVWYD